MFNSHLYIFAVWNAMTATMMTTQRVTSCDEESANSVEPLNGKGENNRQFCVASISFLFHFFFRFCFFLRWQSHYERLMRTNVERMSNLQTTSSRNVRTQERRRTRTQKLCFLQQNSKWFERKNYEKFSSFYFWSFRSFLFCCARSVSLCTRSR